MLGSKLLTGTGKKYFWFYADFTDVSQFSVGRLLNQQAQSGQIFNMELPLPIFGVVDNTGSQVLMAEAYGGSRNHNSDRYLFGEDEFPYGKPIELTFLCNVPNISTHYMYVIPPLPFYFYIGNANTILNGFVIIRRDTGEVSQVTQITSKWNIITKVSCVYNPIDQNVLVTVYQINGEVRSQLFDVGEAFGDSLYFRYVYTSSGAQPYYGTSWISSIELKEL